MEIFFRSARAVLKANKPEIQSLKLNARVHALLKKTREANADANCVQPSNLKILIASAEKKVNESATKLEQGIGKGGTLTLRRAERSTMIAMAASLTLAAGVLIFGMGFLDKEAQFVARFLANFRPESIRIITTVGSSIICAIFAMAVLRFSDIRKDIEEVLQMIDTHAGQGKPEA